MGSVAVGGACAGGPREHPDPKTSLKDLPSLELPSPPIEWRQMLEAQAQRSKPESLELLQRFLDNPAPDVRARAAFTLGLDHPIAYPRLSKMATDDSSALVRAMAVTAAVQAGRTDRPLEAAALIQAALQDEQPHVRSSAASVAWLLDGLEEQGTSLENALMKAASDPDDEVRWRALFSLARRGTPSALGLLQDRALDKSVPSMERLYATRGLAKIGGTDLDATDSVLAALAQLTHDPDWRVAMEATLGLGRGRSERAQGALLEALDHPSFHVRNAAAQGLRPGGRGPLTESLQAAVMDLGQDPSPTLRAAGILAQARVLGSKAEKQVRAAAKHEDPRMRRASLGAALEISPDLVFELSEELLEDPEPQVAGAAVEVLGQLSTNEALRELVLPLLHSTLTREDNGLRLAAVGALGGHIKPSDLARLARCFATSNGDIGPEVRFGIVHAVAKLPEAAPLLRQATQDENPYVAKVAHEALLALAPLEAAATLRAPEPNLPERPDVLKWNEPDPLVRLKTTKGDLLLQLFPREAPLHVASFLTLIESGYYDGLDFHRVVGDFVVQGGCYRGDGNGSGTGFDPQGALPAEFNPLPYLTGTLGMPRNEDPDSGGSQIFITHRPTPHLDGRYTVFGQTLRGFGVLDALEVGDQIVTLERLR